VSFDKRAVSLLTAQEQSARQLELIARRLKVAQVDYLAKLAKGKKS
jgi:hypothetical protein